MKTKTLVLAAIMFLGLGAAAFAQATFSVGSIPVTAVINTGLTELTGDIAFNVVAGTSVPGTITISYGVPITIPLTAVTVSKNGVLIAPSPVNTAASSNTGGVLVINIAAGLIPTDVVRISGIRVAVAGTTLTSLSASISATANAITAGQTSVQVINSIAAGIASVADSKTTVIGVINSVSGGITAPKVKIKEGFLDAWKPSDATNGSLGSGIRLTVTGLPPTGAKITFLMAETTDALTKWQLVNCGDFTVATAAQDILPTSTSPTTVCYQENETAATVPATSVSTQEVLTLNPLITVTGTPPIATATLTFTATMAPIGTAFDSAGKVIPAGTIAGYIPRFVAAEVGPTTLMTVVGTTTTLLMPFAQVVGAAGYDTGISIANTTTDPGATATNLTAPVKQGGQVTFYFFPAAVGGTVPATFSYTTTASSPGSGLNSSGQIPSGSTYVVLLSQLLAAAGKAGDFNGYIFAVAGNTNAHGLFVISNFSTFSQGALMPVIQAPRNTFAIPATPVAEQVTF